MSIVELTDPTGPLRTVVIWRHGQIFINGTADGHHRAEQRREVLREANGKATEARLAEDVERAIEDVTRVLNDSA